MLSQGFCQQAKITLQWRYNGRDGVSNHQSHGCLLNRLFRRRSKKTPKLRVTGLCMRGIHRSPAQMASSAENVSIWWRHHAVNIWSTAHFVWYRLINKCYSVHWHILSNYTVVSVPTEAGTFAVKVKTNLEFRICMCGNIVLRLFSFKFKWNNHGWYEHLQSTLLLGECHSTGYIVW